MPFKRFFLSLLLVTSTASHASDTFVFSNAPGPHAVGLKLIQQYDHSRLYKADIDLATGDKVEGERARPIQTLLWYPAARGGKPLNYRQYLETAATEDSFTLGASEIKRLTDARIESNAGGRREAVLREMAGAMRAVRDARPVEGKFPVVIYAPSYSANAMENADLCEYLASHGYIVLSSASIGARTRSMTVDLEGAEAQAADIAWLIGFAATLPQADTGRVGVVGFSWGGLTNVFAAAKDARIKALVSLDGSLRYWSKLVDGSREAAHYVTPARVTVPLLYLGARPRTVEENLRMPNPLNYSFMNEMKYSDVYIVSFQSMRHANFSSFGMRTVPDDWFGDYTRAEVSVAHSWAARYTRHFLDAYLKNDAAGLAFLNNTPAANGAPPRMLSLDVRRKTDAVPPTLESFVRFLAQEGFEKAIDSYARFTTQHPGFRLSADELFSWGLELLKREAFVRAREIFRLGAQLYPDKAFLVEGLAEMQAKTGQKEEALANYRRVLAIDPQHADAAKYVKAHAP
ncbi:CocE/NonD family hydrolase [Massilia agri]|uniref:Dienelactone hydrolase family protein n=1 Tax=Massilia agri TaxID=1886785 RepID=A0ABT2AK10_9BURK|nr:CocE/NonD family hydrolase [Massilia agri]MCS0596518.1 dienelactone hydrolase family protein [Massilia agri]